MADLNLDAAVEAGARVQFQHMFPGAVWEAPFEGDRRSCRALVRPIIEAAAPLIVKQAKAAAWDECWQVAGDYFADLLLKGPNAPEPPNPYRAIENGDADG